jgi:hypothetical protein
MYAAAIHANFRGVSCRYCGKPIRLSESFIKRATAIKQDEPENELRSRVFPARCRQCHWEAIYALGQIVEFPAEESGSR